MNYDPSNLPAGITPSVYKGIEINKGKKYTAESMLKIINSTYRPHGRPIVLSTFLKGVRFVRECETKNKILGYPFVDDWVDPEVPLLINIIVEVLILKEINLATLLMDPAGLKAVANKATRNEEVIVKFIHAFDKEINKKKAECIGNTPASGNAKQDKQANPFTMDDIKPNPKQMSITEFEHKERLEDVYRDMLSHIVSKLHPELLNTFDCDALVDVVISGKIPEGLTLEDTIVRDNVNNTFMDIKQRENLLIVLKSLLTCKEVEVTEMDHRGMNIAMFHLE